MVESGYGLSTTIIHEVGHHIGMATRTTATTARPGCDFGPTGRRSTSPGAGDETQHDDELHRPQLGLQPVRPRQHGPVPDRRAERGREPAGRGRRAGRPRRRPGADELAAADRLLGASRVAFRGHRYLAASFLAKGAYDLVRKGARQAGVAVVGSHDGWQVDEPGSAAAAAAKLDDATTVDHLMRSHRLRR